MAVSQAYSKGRILWRLEGLCLNCLMFVGSRDIFLPPKGRLTVRLAAGLPKTVFNSDRRMRWEREQPRASAVLRALEARRDASRASQWVASTP